METIMTVLMRCKQVSQKLNQQHTVVTFDEALYYRAKELVWSHPQQLNDVVIRLGGFHTAMNFLGAVGKHMQESGLADVWIESGVYTECTSNKIMLGKSWNRAIRAHKLTMEALWRLLLKLFSAWQARQGQSNFDELSRNAFRISESFRERRDTNIKYSQMSRNDLDEFVLHAEEFKHNFELFIQENAQNATFMFWKQYMDLIETLLLFIRAERDGHWDLHIEAFQQMLPLMAIYDHTHYTRWGVVYLADMKNLSQTSPDVYREFTAGNFSVKKLEGAFNQLPTDQALEQINKLCKVSGGLVGITRTKSALDRWMLICSDMARMIDQIRIQARQSKSVPRQTRKDVGHRRLQRDENDVKKIENQLASFKPFQQQTTDLICISTNDVATEDIKADLLSAMTRGNAVLTEFIEDRLGEKATKQFHDAVVKNKSRTFASLFIVDIKTGGKTKSIKADRDLLRRLLSATASGRKLDLSSLLKHELTAVPLAIATTDGSLRKTDKAVLSRILCEQCETDSLPKTDERTCVLVDAMAVVQALGKPADCTIFSELAECICKYIFSQFKGTCTRVDVIFDTYRPQTIKSGTRAVRSSGKRKIRRPIDSGTTKLPSSWQNFISLEENKVDLIQFLGKELMARTDNLKQNEELVVSGGSVNPEAVVSSKQIPMDHLFSSHEEADTKLVLHYKDAKQKGYIRTVVKSKDTDVLVLFIHHETTPEVQRSPDTSQYTRCVNLCNQML